MRLATRSRVSSAPFTAPKQRRTNKKGRNRIVMLLLRSSLVSRHTESRDESWKAWASEAKGAVQAPAVGIITPGADWAGPTRHRTIARAWKDLSLGFLRCCCRHTYELLK